MSFTTPSIQALPTHFINLHSCSTMADLKQHHARIIKFGLSSHNHAIAPLIKFCSDSKSADFRYALKVFALLPQPDTFIYNSIFRGFLRLHLYRHCILSYAQMLANSVMPSNFTFPPVLRACCIDFAVEEARQVHGQVIKFGFSQDCYCQNNLIYMYIKFDSLEEGRKVFDHLEKKNDVSCTTLIGGYMNRGCVDEAISILESMSIKQSATWNAIIAGYVRNDRFCEALHLFDRVRKENVAMDKFMAASVLSACAGLGALGRGEWMCEYIRNRKIAMDTKLATTIVDMYCKCGRVDKAFEVFNGLSSKGVSTWNSMIGGLAMHGKGMDAINLFKRMEVEASAEPDYITFVNLLTATAHSGLVEEGRFYFSYMTEVYGIAPGMEHYGCLVDLLGRAGFLDEARTVIDGMPVRDDVSVLGALLGACQIHGNIDMAEEIGRRVIELEPENSGRYVMLANLYAKVGRWEEVANIRKLMTDRRIKKVAGVSVVELEGTVNEFAAGGRNHPQAKEIYAKVKEMLASIKDFGYKTDTDGVLYGICDEETDYHSEKLAIAFGLLKTKCGETIRVTKNLRVCKDCHEATKLISKACGREIIVRDRNRFHQFKGGVCSCNGYW